MEFYSSKSKSLPQKYTLTFIEVLLIGFSGWLMFFGGFEFFGLKNNDYALWRYLVIFTFNIVVLIRMSVTMFYLIKRTMPWEEAFSIPMAFALYYVGFTFFVRQNSMPFDIIDALGIFLFLWGSYLNTSSELKRNKWKQNPENKGQLYTEGLFKYSMHINYFGDLLWVSGYAVITRNYFSIIVPIFLFCFFAFYNAPKLDSYLSEKYKDEFEKYHKSTKKIIPFIY